jgi:damage-control phosphatase, subfamily I
LDIFYRQIVAFVDFMKVKSYCLSCLRNLAKDVALLTEADDELLDECYLLIDKRFSPEACPPDIANEMLRLLREKTHVDDPYRYRKAEEFSRALSAAPMIARSFSSSLEGVLKCSVMGNSVDVFVEPDYDRESFIFSGDTEEIGEEIDRSGQQALIFGDNIGELFFDLPLIRHLQGRGKEVSYAVKAAPAQNDLSMADVESFGLREWFPNFISTGSGTVGMRRDEMSPQVRRLWESDALVIAKGMGNYETISEFDHERRVIYVMKLKCPAVAESVKGRIGEYTAILGGDHGKQ